MYLLSLSVSDRGRCWHFVYVIKLVGSGCTCSLYGLVIGVGTLSAA